MDYLFATFRQESLVSVDSEGSFLFAFPMSCRVVFTGTVVVLPDILALASTGERAECRRESSRRNAMAAQEGVKGLRALGVRDLSYRLAFIANSVQVSNHFNICTLNSALTTGIQIKLCKCVNSIC